MKLFTLLIFCIAVANAMVDNKKENGNIIPSPTILESTKVEKRAFKTTYEDIETYNIFEEGWEKWDERWVTTDCWDNPEFEVKDGVIVARLKDNAGFALTNPNMLSEYGVLDFDYKLETDDGSQASLNLVVFNNDGKYFNFPNYPRPYQNNGKYEHITQEMIDNSGNNVSRLQRLAWQNYGNNGKVITVYIKNITFVDKKIIINKFSDPISILDTGKCALGSDWKNISKDTSKTKFNVVSKKCVMSITVSDTNPLILQYTDENFRGGKFEITIKSTDGSNSAFILSAYNTEDSSITGYDNTLIANGNFEERKDEFETDKEYNAISISPIEGEALFEISSFIFSSIPASETGLNYEITHLTEPDVILDENGLSYNWQENSWSCTCSRQPTSGATECSFQGSYGAFSFQTNRNLDAGTLYINMKVLYPNRMVTIQVHHPNNDYENVYQIPDATTEYRDYYVDIPSNRNQPTTRFAIQEGSEQENTYYIRKIIYYPSYIDVPTGGSSSNTKTTTTKTKTTTRKTRTGTQEPTLPPKTEEEINQDNGYEICSQNIKLAYAEIKDDVTYMYGFDDDKWCAIIDNSCWSLRYGVQCCSSNAKVTGAWGTESDGTKCGSTDSNACWAKNLGFECCTRNESDIIFVDKDGAWGTKNNKWCGIK